MLEWTTYLRFAIALAVVLALVALLGWALRRTTALGRAAQSGLGRLGVVESTSLDARRRLVLVRRDGTLHLLLLSPTSELVIETGIAAHEPARLSAQE